MVFVLLLTHVHKYTHTHTQTQTNIDRQAKASGKIPGPGAYGEGGVTEPLRKHIAVEIFKIQLSSEPVMPSDCETDS